MMREVTVAVGIPYAMAFGICARQRLSQDCSYVECWIGDLVRHCSDHGCRAHHLSHKHLRNRKPLTYAAGSRPMKKVNPGPQPE